MLTSHIDGWNIVLSGHWDSLIFTPNWVRANIASDKEVSVELPTVAALPPRLVFDSIYLLVVDNKLLLGMRKIDDAALASLERSACRVLELLPHTPLTATGVNFAFIENKPGPLALAIAPHEAAAIAKAKLQLRGGTVRRSAILGERTVNWTLEARDADSTLLSINFHFDTPHSSSASGALRKHLLELRTQAFELVSKLYDETVVVGG